MFEVGKIYRTTDWFTGGIHIYKCTERTGDTVTLAAVYYEMDGMHIIQPETFEIQKDEKEYVVLYCYKGHENRIYAD